MEEWASSQGKTVDEVKAAMKELYQDPNKVWSMIEENGPASAWVTDLYIAGVKVTNWLFGKQSTVPLNGPRIIKLLCDVHAHEVFVDGMFNSDPHAGNIMQMEDGRL